MSKYASWASALSLLATFVAHGVQAADPAPLPAKIDHQTLRPDPSVKRGVLPNGLRYLVARNANPAGAVSLRFAVDVGSYEETEAERGSAHFVEHMAFRSTRSFPEGASDRVFAPWGVAFGRDQNATTSLFSTTYQLDLPKPDQTQLKTAFGWLRDAADGVVFTDETVNRERGVVLAEMEARSSALSAAQEAVGKFQAGAVRSTNRSPIGLKETVSSATAVSLKQFYDRWYRPEHAFVVVAGDLPVGDMTAMVISAFSDWTDKGPKPDRTTLVSPAMNRPLDAFSLAGPSLPTVVSACRIRPAGQTASRTVADLRRLSQAQAWQDILNQRLNRRMAAGDAHLLGATMLSNDGRDMAGACLVVVPTDGAWDEALHFAQLEVSRFAKDGPTEIETENAVEVVRSRLRGEVLNTNSLSSASLANNLVTRALIDEVITSPADTLYAYDLALEDMTPEDVRARFIADWSASAPLLATLGPKPPTREALMAAWSKGVGEAATERYADQTVATWRYTSFGKPGKVVERTTVSQPGFVRLRFANGLILNFKQSKLEPNKSNIRLNFGAGRWEIDDSQYMAAQFGSPMLIAGGLGQHSFEDIQAIFASRATWTFQFGVGPRAFGMSAAAFSSGLDAQLQILAAYMSDPGFRPSLDARVPDSVDIVYRTILSQPASALGLAVAEAIAPGSPGNLPPQDVLAKLKSADFERIFKPVLTTAPIELTIVGDIDEASAIQAVSTTFGALPSRPKARRERAEPRFLRYPQTSPPPIRIEHQGPADKAAAVLIWPLYVSTPERRREEYTLKLLALVFDTALRRRVREELGKTYAPEVGTTGPDFGDQGVLQVSVESEPGEIEVLVSEARAVAAKLKAGDITAQMLEDARQPILARVRAYRQTNGWWADAMGGSDHNPAVLEEALKFEPLMSAVTVEDLRAAAAKWLAREPVVGVALPKAVHGDER